MNTFLTYAMSLALGGSPQLPLLRCGRYVSISAIIFNQLYCGEFNTRANNKENYYNNKNNFEIWRV